ncbi:hypothetical protein BDW60DRAFT_193518 [Aspergillus nidulans var. acristatus]
MLECILLVHLPVGVAVRSNLVYEYAPTPSLLILLCHPFLQSFHSLMCEYTQSKHNDRKDCTAIPLCCRNKPP